MGFVQNSSSTLSSRLGYRFFMTSFAGALALACTPATETVVDGGAEVVDSGSPVDAGTPVVDSGQPVLPPVVDGGAADDCPAFNPVVGAPVGQSCGTEGLRCGPEGCLAPGPGACAFVICRDGTWQFETIAPSDDAGSPAETTDAGVSTEADAGAGTDVDAGSGTDSDAGAGSDSDAGSGSDSDAGSGTDSDASNDED